MPNNDNNLLLASLKHGLGRYRDIIARHWKASPNLVLALMQAESAFVETAKRHEPGYQKRYIGGVKRWDEYAAQHNCYAEDIATSYGLMQLMAPTACQYGFRGHPAGLFDPEVNVLFGARYLEALFRRHYSLNTVIAAYNAGTPRQCADGTFKNQEYVEKVRHRMYLLESMGIREALGVG